MTNRSNVKAKLCWKSSPVGDLAIVTSKDRLELVTFRHLWEGFKSKFPGVEVGSDPYSIIVCNQLDEYFAGERMMFDLDLNMKGTSFQNQVWNSLVKIPYGKVITYKEQACLIDNPKAVRAVGRANGLNPFCIVLPCHRVVGSNGELTGYAGGIKHKKFLLEMEALGAIV